MADDDKYTRYLWFDATFSAPLCTATTFCAPYRMVCITAASRCLPAGVARYLSSIASSSGSLRSTWRSLMHRTQYCACHIKHARTPACGATDLLVPAATRHGLAFLAWNSSALLHSTPVCGDGNICRTTAHNICYALTCSLTQYACTAHSPFVFACMTVARASPRISVCGPQRSDLATRGLALSRFSVPAPLIRVRSPLRNYYMTLRYCQTRT